MEPSVAWHQGMTSIANPLFARGFSLIELMITLVIFAILMLLAVPSFQTYFLNSQQSALSSALLNSLNFARLTAITQKIPVQVCPFRDINSTACGVNWALGWIAVTQPASGSPVVIQSYRANTKGPVLSVAGGITSISFNSLGLTSVAVNMKICDSRGATFASSLMVLPTGYTQVGSTAGQAVWNGGALTCP